MSGVERAGSNGRGADVLATLGGVPRDMLAELHAKVADLQMERQKDPLENVLKNVEANQNGHRVKTTTELLGKVVWVTRDSSGRRR